MYEIINWIIFGLFTIALIADGAYALNCLSKTEADYNYGNMTILFIIYSLSICLFLCVLSMTTPDVLGLRTTLGMLLVDSIVMTAVGFINHYDVISNYKQQLNEFKNICKQQPIKI